MKIVINVCFGGFSLSRAALEWLAKRGYLEAVHELAEVRAQEVKNDPYPRDSFLRDIPRNHPLFIECVEKLGTKASGSCACLEIVKVDNKESWYVHEYDGNESVEIFKPANRGVNLVPLTENA